jgi:hypothetical protein
LFQREFRWKSHLCSDLLALVVKSENLNNQYSGTLFDREPLLSITLFIALHALILIVIDQELRTAVAVEPLFKCELTVLIVSWNIEMNTVELLKATGGIFAF